MKREMQNSKFKMQTARVCAAVVVCILHFAFCIDPAWAQLQPGTPGQMGEVKLFKEKPQIEVSKPEQIKVAEEGK